MKKLKKYLSENEFLAQQEAVRYKKERPDMCEISFAEGFEHAMKLVKKSNDIHSVSKSVKCKECNDSRKEWSDFLEEHIGECIHCC